MIGLKRGTVQVISYQPVWKDFFEEEAARLRLALGNQIINIEHVGSTAIEGMDAKPIIDIIVEVESLNKARDLVKLVENLGYKCKKNDNVPERIFFIKGPSSNRTHHLSFTEPTSGYWKAHILFRDYLLTQPEAAEEYKRLKRELAEQFPKDRDAYRAGKQEFIKKILGLVSFRNETN
ncbi:MAG: GrpB family protein [Euryarchaeota archaeon]|nr:GrpB family protein [Euryarchaeota archaeon]